LAYRDNLAGLSIRLKYKNLSCCCEYRSYCL